MAKKTTQTLGAAAGEPQGYLYPGTIAGRKFVFEELTIRAMRQFQAMGTASGAGEQVKTDTLIDLVFDMLTSPKVTVVEGAPFTPENVDELGVKDVIALFRFFANPKATLEELTASAQEPEGETDEDPKAEA